MADVCEKKGDHTENIVVSSDSETEGDDCGDNDYDEIRRNIKPILNLGRTLTALWPIPILDSPEVGDENYCDGLGNVDAVEGPWLSKSLDWPHGSMQDWFFEAKHKRAPSLPSHGKLEQIKLQLDEIYLNPDEEYGFNPRRNRQKLGQGPRCVSLYASNELAERLLILNNSNEYPSVVSSPSNSKDEKSHARNAEEAKIEEDIAFLRAQPSNVEFNRKGKVKEHIESLIKGMVLKKEWRMSKSLKRKSSFDAHHRHRTFSEGAKPSYELLNRNSFSKCPGKKLEHQNLLRNECSNHEFYGSEPILNHQQQEVKLAPHPSLGSKTTVEVLVSSPTEKVKKKRAGIPHFLTTLKLPNKVKIKSFMKKKSERRPSPFHQIVPSPVSAETVNVDSEMGISAENHRHASSDLARSPSINTFAKTNRESGVREDCKRKLPFNSSIQAGRNSCSMCSLQKLEEGKETSEFDGSLNRKSCSTCSLAFVKLRKNSKIDASVLERRLSDTALTWKDENHPGSSPGRRLLLKLLSPVVCGLNSDTYMNFQSSESYSSLGSCSSETSTEADLLSQKLPDFDVQEIAEELSLIDKELLIRITWQELATCGWMSINKYVTSPNVMNMVEFFNRVAMMVATGILVEETAYLRAKAITKMVKLAVKCHHLKNYNSLRAVLAGLQCTPIYRLEASWKQVRARRKKTFGELSNLMSEDHNFSAYREELKQSLKDSPCIPFLGDFLTQIAQTQAYVAMRRKRSLAKQRLEKASTTSFPEKNVRETEAVNSHCSKAEENTTKERGRDTCLRLEKLEENNTEKIEKHGEENLSDLLPENREKYSDLSFTGKKDEKNSNDDVSNFGIDEVDENMSDIENRSKYENKNNDINRSEVDKEKHVDLPHSIDGDASKEEGENACVANDQQRRSMQCEEHVSPEVEGDEYVNLNRKDRENLRRSIKGITKAMFQSGRSYQSSENDNEVLEALNEYLETQTEGEMPVFPDIDIEEGRDVASSSSAIEIQNSKCLDTCSDDYGVGSASSYELSPVLGESDVTTCSHAVEEKKTHARNDSNDSGVVLQSGRLSRASAELSESHDNVSTVTSETNHKTFQEDSKLPSENEVSLDEKSGVDGRSRNAAPILDENYSELKKLEERIKKEKPLGEETKHKKEVQFWEYQITAMKYHLTQRPILRRYLLNACYNSEEENYSLSLKREPIAKKQ